MNTGTFSALSLKWREEAEVVSRHGVFGDVGSLLESFAAELDGAIRKHVDELLTIEEAVEESGYSRRAIEDQLKSGKLPNAGKPRQPRVRRGDLPYRPHTGGLQGSELGAIVAEVARDKWQARTAGSGR